MSRTAWLLLLPFCLAGADVVLAESGKPVKQEHWSTQYDNHFRKYTKRYFGPYFDWHWFKAQAIAESNLKPDVTSPRGAVGLMQILPSTFAEIKQENPHFSRLEEPRWNIAAGIFYDRYLYRKWELPSEQQRLYLAFASYNAGFGRIRQAFRRSPEPVENWEQVQHHAPQETQDYVVRIRELMAEKKPMTRRLRGISRHLFVAQEERS